MEDATKPQYPVAFVIPTEDGSSKLTELILCYTVPAPNSTIRMKDAAYTVLETPHPEYGLIKHPYDQVEWLVPILTLKLKTP